MLDEISTFEKSILKVLNDAVSLMRQAEIRNALIKIEKGMDISSDSVYNNIFREVQEKRRRKKQITLENINIAMNNLESKNFVASSNQEGGARVYIITTKGKKLFDNNCKLP